MHDMPAWFRQQSGVHNSVGDASATPGFPVAEYTSSHPDLPAADPAMGAAVWETKPVNVGE